MDLNNLVEVGKVAVTVICGGLALYFKYSVKAQTKAKQVQETIAEVTAKAVIFIKQAENDYKDITNAGGRKFNDVVENLHDLVPVPLRGIITKQMIADIVQSTFDEIEQYVQLQLDKAIENTEE